MKTSQNGIDLIKKFEGFSAIPYKCMAGKLTIGYGHVIKHYENYKKLTTEEAEEILKKDVEFVENFINKNVSKKLNQNQFDALVSLVFNIGVGNFGASTLLKYLNSCEFEKAANEFDRWIYVKKVKSKGLAKRRKMEKELFNYEKENCY